MSSNEKQNSDNDRIDLVALFRSVWFHKISLSVVTLLSIPVFIAISINLTPRYKAETVFEKPNDKISKGQNSLLSGIQGAGLIGLSGFQGNSSSGSFYSEIRSDSFLKTVFLDNAKLNNKKFQELCPLPSNVTSRLSISSLLVFLGLSENRVPSESQKISLLVQCVNNMLEIDYDTYGPEKSSAYRLSVTSADPFFSANLVNQIVEKYFIRFEKSREQDFQNVKKYLSKVIADAQLEVTQATKLMQSFIIRNTLLMNIEPVSGQSTVGLGAVPASPFAPELYEEIANLSQLEKSLNQLKQARLNLSGLREQDYDSVESLISSSEVQGMLSRTFFTSIANIDKLTATNGLKNREIKKVVNQELRSLEQQIKSIEDKIINREEQTLQLMSIENRFQELAIDVSKKQLMFEGLKDQLKDKILTTGLANIRQPILYTRASPPFVRDFPDKKLIVFLGALASFFAGIAYILVRQTFLRRIFTLTQLQNLSKFLSCYQIKEQHINEMGESSDRTVMSQSFFSNTKKSGRLGCIIDLSQKRQENYLAATISNAVAKSFAVDHAKIICLNSLQNRKPFSIYSVQNLIPSRRTIEAQSVLDKRVVTISDEDGMIANGEITKIKKKYSDYDKIICALGSEVGDLQKFSFIEQCDFYILVGRSFHTDEYTYEKFSNTGWEKEKKCLGFFLIN